MRKVLILLLVACFLYPVTSDAGIYGILKGKVVDDEGKPVIGATVRVEGTTRGTYVKDKNGSFTIVNIPAGTYTVKVTSVGFNEYNVKVTISADQTSNISVELTNKVTETEGIEVVGAKVMVNNGAVGKVQQMGSEEITSTVGTSVQSVIGFTAGAVTGGGGVSIRGARNTETQIRVDGVDVSNQFTGGAGGAGMTYAPIVSSFATEEIQVLTGGFSAEYGDALGGIVNTMVKHGRNNKYEGFINWTRPFGLLYGSNDETADVIRDGNQLKIIQIDGGADLFSSNENQFDIGFGGPLPLPVLENSTFYIATKYQSRTENSGYDIQDPSGLTISDIPGSGIWMKNITGNLKFSISQDIQLIVGGQFGLTSWANSSWNWYFADDPGVFYDTTSQGEILETTNGIPERVMKQNVSNSLMSTAYIKLNHTIDSKSFYELKVSTSKTNDETARRVNTDDPGFFTGFDFLIPQDNIRFSNSGLVWAGTGYGDGAVDHYQQPTAFRTTSDGYLFGSMPIVNPLTGYFEGPGNSSGTKNSYGLQYFFVTHGSSGFQLRRGSYYQIEGSYTKLFTTPIGEGEGEEFSHIFKTGFEFRTYEMGRHYNQSPSEQSPFFDVYTDEWGGNFYVDYLETAEKTSKPVKPWRMSAYAQDQVTYKGVIFSPGVRFDYFNPNLYSRPEGTDVFLGISDDSLFVDSDAKIQVSPRINVAYPITASSNISINYGMYFQMPQVGLLYDNFFKDDARGNQVLGDPNIDAQRTNQYQVQYENQFTDEMSISATLYYRDIYNQVGLVYYAVVPDPFYQYAVNEYGNSRGLELTLRKMHSDNYGFRLNYTLGYLEGTSSGSGSNYNPPVDPYTDLLAFPLSTYALSNDVRHRFNFIIDLFLNDEEGPEIGGVFPLANTRANFSGLWRSGYPYTKINSSGVAIGEQNGERNPSYWNINLRLSKTFNLKDIFGESAADSQLELYFNIFNLLDRQEPTGYYPATSDPDDDGISIYRSIGVFSSVSFYDEPDYSIAETFSSDQYDLYGERLYNINSDHDRNGIVTQLEKYESYINYIRTLVQFRGRYQTPRTAEVGLYFHF